MEDNTPENKFIMEEPKEIGFITKFGFWLITSEEYLFDVVRRMLCVSDVTMTNDTRALVEISDLHDADEAWHWIRTAIEEELRFVELDSIWEDAMWL